MTTLATGMTDGLKRAARVLELVKLEALEHLYVMAYHNGRENGFAVRGWDRMWVFSEDRRSDYMVLYVGKATEFGAGNVPSDKVYSAKRLLKTEEELAAVLTTKLQEDVKFYVEVIKVKYPDKPQGAESRP